MGDQQGRVYTQRASRGWCVTCAYRSRDRQQVGHAKGDTGRDGDLAQQIEPVLQPVRALSVGGQTGTFTYQPVTQEANADTF